VFVRGAVMWFPWSSHLLKKNGIRPPPDRVKLKPSPNILKNVKELRRLLELFNWFRKFIP